MNKSVVIILVGAICTAVLVAIGVQAVLKSDPVEGAAPIEMAQILVASEKLSQGEFIESEKVRWKDWPEESLIKGMYVRKDGQKISELKVIDKPLRRQLELGEPVTSSAIVEFSEKGSNFMAATIAPDKLAFSIPVTPASSVGGFAGPGDFVDIILTYKVKIPNSVKKKAQGRIQSHASETIIKGVRILAIDQTLKEDDREARVGKVATLEVSPKEVEMLSLAMEMGDISLALRRLGANAQDDKTARNNAPTTDVEVGRMMKQLSELENGGVDGDANISPDGRKSLVKIYRAGQVQSVTVPRSGAQ